MVEVAGMWEFGWNTPILEADLWEMAMREFGVKRLNMTPVSGIDKRWISEYPSISELLEAKKGLDFVFFDEHGDTSLSDFVHPENALYIFGKTSCSNYSDFAKKHACVKIESARPGFLWGHQALTLALYDRKQKHDHNLHRQP